MSDKVKVVPKLKVEESALILIEFQNDFTTAKGKLHDAVKPVMEKTKMLDNAIKMVAKCREKKIPVVFCPIKFAKGYGEISGKFGVLKDIKGGKCFEDGEWGSEFYDKMKPQKGDLVVTGKKGLCGFASTNLDFILRQNGIKNVMLTGFLTNVCVESTMRTAYEKGYNVYTLPDCCAATSQEAHDNTIKNNYPVFSKVMKSIDVLKLF